ncbi:MAG: PilZ domain-containing protein [Desulfobacterales bacterium]|nr:PilZ domain-containing protein [Desulfobacterales bacterium]
MVDSNNEEKAVLEAIIKETGSLSLDQKKEVLHYIRSINQPRTYPRIRKRIEIDIMIDDKIIRSDTKDMSAAGVYVKTPVKTQIGKAAKVVFSLPGQKRPFKLDGRVVRTESGGIALWFSEMTTYTRENLNKLLSELDYPQYSGKEEDSLD